jgi:hypothetical protein
VKAGKISRNRFILLSIDATLKSDGGAMFWTFTFEMLPGEEVIDDTARKSRSGIKPAYSVFLTNKRVIFRFDGLGSSLLQSFFYNEIQDVATTKRLFFTYLELKTKKKSVFFHIADADYWSNKILEIRKQIPPSNENRFDAITSPLSKKRELMDMITILRKNSLLTDSELEEKVHLLDSMKF